MNEFRIRDTAVRTAREEVLALVAERRLSWEDLHARLEPGEISVVQEMPPSLNWYPVATYDRLVTTLMDVEGGGSSEYLVERGKKAVESLTAPGLELRIEEASLNRETADPWWAARGSRPGDTALGDLQRLQLASRSRRRPRSFHARGDRRQRASGIPSPQCAGGTGVSGDPTGRRTGSGHQRTTVPRQGRLPRLPG